MADIDKEYLIKYSEKLYENINQNFISAGEKLNIESEADRFYFGLLRRQLIISSDICCLLKYGFNHYLTTIFILGRTIYDDYLQLHYVANHADPEEQIKFLNSESYNKNFAKLRELADLNESILDGNFPYYPTNKFIADLENHFRSTPNRSQYLKDIIGLKFFKFKTKREIVDSYKNTSYMQDIGRVYYNWRHLSDYTHFSNMTYDFETGHDSITNEYNDIFEMLLFSYKASKLSFSYFENNYGITHKPEKDLQNTNAEYLKENI